MVLQVSDRALRHMEDLMELSAFGHQVRPWPVLRFSEEWCNLTSF
jgi:hypothetical protein